LADGRHYLCGWPELKDSSDSANSREEGDIYRCVSSDETRKAAVYAAFERRIFILLLIVSIVSIVSIDVLREGLVPQLEAAIEAVHIGKTLMNQVSSSALARVAVIAGDDQWMIEIRSSNKAWQGLVVQVR